MRMHADRPRRSRFDRQIRRLLRSTPLTAPASRWAVGVAAGVGVLGIGLVDEVSGPEVTLSVVYLLPISLAAILVSPRVGYLVAAEAVLVWAAADALGGDGLATPTVLWNATLRLVIFVVVVFLIGSLREAVEDAERAGLASKQFLSAAAHQLRTPISGVMVSAEALSVETDPDRRRRLTDHLITSSERLGRLMTGLLELARSTESAPPRPRPAELVSVLRAEADAVVADDVKVVVSGEPTATALIDVEGFREALANVLDNAVGRAASRVEVEVDLAGDEVLVWVADDGPGVPPGSEAAVFERFRRLDDRGGAGLGLPIARSLMRAMGGDVDLRDGRFVLVATRG